MSVNETVKLVAHEDAGIRSIRDLTKEELIECIERTLKCDSSARYWFDNAVHYVAARRMQKKTEADAKLRERWIELQKEYEELLRPYAGKKIGELPTDVIKKGAGLERAIREAQKKYFATFEGGGKKR